MGFEASNITQRKCFPGLGLLSKGLGSSKQKHVVLPLLGRRGQLDCSRPGPLISHLPPSFSLSHQIYNEMIRDLLNPALGYLELREDSKGVIQVAGITEVSTINAKEASLQLLARDHGQDDHYEGTGQGTKARVPLEQRYPEWWQEITSPISQGLRPLHLQRDMLAQNCPGPLAHPGRRIGWT